MDIELVNNEVGKQYEFHTEGLVSKIKYNIKSDKIYLVHTEVPKELAGRGIASSLAKSVLEDIHQKELKLIPICPFVQKYIKRHPEWEFLVFKDEN